MSPWKLPPATQAGPPAGATSPWLPLLLVAGWGLEIVLFGMARIYTLLGVYAAFAALVLAWSRGPALKALLTPGPRDVAIGVGGGLLMIALTYPVYGLAAAHIPGLPDQVRSLYSVADMSGRPLRLVALVGIIVVEELLWRGALFDALAERWPLSLAIVAGVASYALVQVGTGSWVMPVIALVCGTLWSLERAWTAGLVAPLLTHAIWDLVVLVWWPLEPR